MKKVFWENPYQCSLETKVADVAGNQVLFEETIAYSFSGGQESDRGTVNGIPLLDSKWRGIASITRFRTDMGSLKGPLL